MSKIKIEKEAIKSAAKAYTLDVLGKEQFENNKEAAKSIAKDFISGAEWVQQMVKSFRKLKIK